MTAVNSSMQSDIPTMTETVTIIVDEMQNAAMDDDLMTEWDEIGYQMDMGIAAGVERGESEVINRIVRVVKAAIAAARAAAGIRSPSWITEEMGYFMDKGLILGLEKNAGGIAKAAASTIKSALFSMSKVIHTSDTLNFASRMLSGGLASGANKYSSQLLKIGTKFLEDTNREFDETFEKAKEHEDIFDKLGIDMEDLSYDIVVNLDTNKAEEDLTDLEKAILKYRNAKVSVDNRDVMEWEEWLGESGKYDRYKELSKIARGNLRGYFTGDLSLEDYRAQWSAQREWDAAHLTYTEMMSPDELASLIAEYRDLNRRHMEVTDEYEQYVRDFWNGPASALQEIAVLLEQMKESSASSTVEQERLNYTQNIYSIRPLSTLDVYRNTNQLLSKFQ